MDRETIVLIWCICMLFTAAAMKLWPDGTLAVLIGMLSNALVNMAMRTNSRV